VDQHIHELCELIANERNPENLKELAEALQFARTEYNLQIQNQALLLAADLSIPGILNESHADAPVGRPPASSSG
jgi:hypothetical protein